MKKKNNKNVCWVFLRVYKSGYIVPLSYRTRKQARAQRKKVKEFGIDEVTKIKRVEF